MDFSHHKRIQVWTDGSCYWKPKLGGIGVYIKHEDGKEEAISKGYSNTTTTRMEIRALLEGLKKIKHDIPVIANFYIDNQHVCEAISKKYVFIWNKNGLDNYKNPDLWRKVLIELKIRPLLKIYANHVRGHQKLSSAKTKKEEEIILGNLVADDLANYKQFSTYTEDTRF